MSSASEPKTSTSLRSGFFLTFFLILCFAMTGTAGYVKMQLDKAEIALVAPDEAFSTEENLYEKTVLNLGYGGFLGAAQTYMSKMDRTALGQMRQFYETANEAALAASKNATVPIRRDIKAVMDIYRKIVVLAETGGDALSSGITQSDLMMASGAMATLNARLQTLQARDRVTAQSAFKKWSSALMLVAWAAILLATGLSLWTFSAQEKQLKGPIKSLVQSIANMTKGDLNKSIWGLERSDEIGDLARAMNIARLYFLEIPDISIVESNGTTRLKFDGESRSMFQNMMNDIKGHFEGIAKKTNSYSDEVTLHQETLAEMNRHIKEMLEEFKQQDDLRETIVKSLSCTLEDAATSLASSQEKGVQNLCASTETLLATQEKGAQKLHEVSQSLTETQEKGIKQIKHILPAMENRLHSMEDISQQASTQISHSLSSLLKTEKTLRNTSNQGQQSIKQLAGATGQMGEHMFAALNLMQASGKQFNDTTDSVRMRLSEAVETLRQGEDGIQDMIQRTESRLAGTVNAEENMSSLATRAEESAIKMEHAVDSITDRHELLNEQVVTAAHRMESIMANFDAAQRAMSDATGYIRRDSSLISNILEELRKNNNQLLSSLSQSSQSGFSAVQNLAEKSHALMQRLEVQIQNQAKTAEEHLDEMSTYSQSMAQQASSTNGSLGQAITSLKSEQEKLSSTRKRFTETLNDIGMRLEEHATSTFSKTEEWASKSFVKLTNIAEQVEGVMNRLSMLGQLTGTLGAVAGQLGQIVPALTEKSGSSLPMPTISTQVSSSAPQPPIIIDMDDTKELIVKQTEDVLKKIQGQWHEANLQMEAMHDQLAQIVVQQKDQLETRLVVLDKKLTETSNALLEDVGEGSEEEDRQGEIINELVTAMSKINEHVMELDDVVEDAGLSKKEAS
ncbi:MAG TPA: hypothetical protein DD400_00115 [Rhodospirillaceae bacterium]|nr:hypothetical protein [Rhodospirillaceae bacterium]